MKIGKTCALALSTAMCLTALLWRSAVLAQAGRLERLEITCPRLENLIGDPTTKPLNVYVPASYQTSAKEYPVVYVLHGFFGNAESLTNITPTIDALVGSGDVPEMIYVFADGSNRFNGSMYLSSPTIGDYEGYIATDMVAFIDSHYRTIASRQSRGITGFSMGGWGSMRFAMKYPQIYGAVVAQAGAYNLDTKWWQGLSGMACWLTPADWSEYGKKVDAFSQFVFAMSAAANPNPARPPFYLDMAYEVVDNKTQVVPERWAKQLERDTVNGLLDGYVGQSVKLEGIKFVHGAADNVVPVSQARTLDAALTERGVEHVYVEHAGGHDFLPRESLQFFAEHLSVQPVASAVGAASWGAVKAVHGDMR